MFIFGSNTADFLLLLLSYRQTTPTMSFIQAFMEQSVYLGMPDDSVRNTVVPVAKAKHPVFLFSPVSSCGMLGWKNWSGSTAE